MHRIVQLLTAGAVVAVVVGPSFAGVAAPYDVPRMKSISIDGDAGDWGDGGFRVDVLADRTCVAQVDQPIFTTPAPAENQAFFGSRIQRTMALLATSSSQRRQPVRILFYGQSIVHGSWTRMFVSNSGRIVIEPRDFVIHDSYRILKATCPPGFEIQWEVVPRSVDVYKPPVPDENAWQQYAGRVHLTTVAHGLTNGPHVLEIVPVGDGPVPIEEIHMHRPPLH